MSLPVSDFRPSLGNFTPRSDLSPSKCTYIINKGKTGERKCPTTPRSGSRCAKHKGHRSQVQEEENDDDDGSFISGLFSRLELSTRESTPEADTPTRPRTKHSNLNSIFTSLNSSSLNTARNQSSSTSSVETPTRTITARNQFKFTSAMSTPTSTDIESTPRPSTRGYTPEVTLKPASTRESRSSLFRAALTSSTSIGTGGGGSDKLAGQLNNLNATSNDGIEELAAQIQDFNVEDKDDQEWPEMWKPDIYTESVVSYGPRDSYERGLKRYLMKGLDDTLIKDLIERLPIYPRDKDGEGYVYIYLATPVQSLQMATENNENQRSTEASKGDMSSKEKIIVKVGSSAKPDQRLRNLHGKCGQYRYKHLEVFPKERTVAFRYKAEKMAQVQLQHWRYRPKDGCICHTEHKELFEITKGELKYVFRCVNHWATIVNAHHEKLWPRPVEKHFQADGQ